MKKSIFYIGFTFSVLLLISSCTEIIDININASHPQVVVEAIIGSDKQALVLISRTDDLNGDNEFQQIENAQVSISDNDGNKVLLNEISAGHYGNTSAGFLGTIGKTYELNIELDDEIISASSTIPALVPIDSLTVINSIYPGGGPPVGNQPAPFYEIYVHYSDPVALNNYYRLKLYVNGTAQAGNRVYDDTYNNGQDVEQRIIIYNDTLTTGDKFLIEMQCIDANVYNYFQSMGNSSMGGGSPANPYTNLTGAILGYFSAHTVERKEYIIP